MIRKDLRVDVKIMIIVYIVTDMGTKYYNLARMIIMSEVQTKIARVVPCKDGLDCKWNWSCVGEARGCPRDGRHQDVVIIEGIKNE